MTSPDIDRLVQAIRAAESASEQRLVQEIRSGFQSIISTIQSAQRDATEERKEILEFLRHERDVRDISFARHERLHALQVQLKETRTALEASLRAEAATRGELESLWGSTSWRYTRPLREIGLVVRRMLRQVRSSSGAAPDAGGGADESTSQENQGGTATPEGLSPPSARVLDELQQAMRDVRR